MDIVMKASTDASTYGDIKSSHIGLTSSVPPEAKTPLSGERSQTGVSTKNAHERTEHWYALRTTYGREKKAHDFIISHEGKAFLPTIIVEKVVNGKKQLVEVSRLPNIFFAYGTEEEIKSFVYDNYNLPYLRFYYKHTHVSSRVDKAPMIVPDSQIKTLKIICDAEVEDKHIEPFVVEKFKAGQLVRVKEGPFAGVEGTVHRYKGQQRIGIVIEGLFTITTAYISKEKLELVETSSDKSK
ncbi:MAG: UpxY family transcription antiterminator [Bacteroidales bacterium]|nr:UpxY family transcription antiterminator [Bacteroidales bacterium]MCM1147458.1 UpxY family transcription antiterminator [Bacteroidales bacterium]MCM1206127.1 UpxY family transcription antiterminator [Bacillota bacterium]MCM1510042.1 UpxY family transcription antiterminator [Clostridium sp.]